MQKDLKLIKKYYGENMAHLCRELFPTILEEEGLLIKLLESRFAHNRFLYEDIIVGEIVDEFQSYIYSLLNEPQEYRETSKSVEELMDEAGYNFYECKSEEDIQKFKKYYENNEKLCTFNGNRLNSSHVFFAVKKNVEQIKRNNFLNPKRQDEYGTSVISIQFTKGKVNTLSIKNRYNHTVNNPDATFKNNLENIIPGLTYAFSREYNLNITQNTGSFKMTDYAMASDGKFYKYNHEMNNIYYGPNNIIIDKFQVKKEFLDKSRYLIIDMFILDIKEKKFYKYDPVIPDKLPSFIGEIKKIDVINIDGNDSKIIRIINEQSEDIYLILDSRNRIIGYINNHIKEITDRFFMFCAYSLKYFEARNLEKIGNCFLNGGLHLETFIAPELREIGDAFLAFNNSLEVFDSPKILKVGAYCLSSHEEFSTIFQEKVKKLNK